MNIQSAVALYPDIPQALFDEIARIDFEKIQKPEEELQKLFDYVDKNHKKHLPRRTDLQKMNTSGTQTVADHIPAVAIQAAGRYYYGRLNKIQIAGAKHAVRKYITENLPIKQ